MIYRLLFFWEQRAEGIGVGVANVPTLALRHDVTGVFGPAGVSERPLWPIIG